MLEKGNLLEGLNKVKSQYIANEYEHNDIGYGKISEEEILQSEVYKRLIELFGKDIILNLDEENVDMIRAEFQKYNASFDWFSEDYNKLFDDKISDYEKKDLADVISYSLDLLEKNKNIVLENECNPTEIATRSINLLKSLIMENVDIPDYLKSKMILNLESGVKDVCITKISEFGGLYHPNKKEVEISNKLNKVNKRKALIHELTHAATTSRDRLGRPVRVGLADKYNNAGNGLNEGATEYISSKLYNDSGPQKGYDIYPELVAIIKDSVNLYSEDIILGAVLDGPEKLEELMEKDGKSYSEFRELTDDYYKYVYNNKEQYYKVRKEIKAKELYAKIGCFIEEIKNKRHIENPEALYNESEWENAYYSLLELKKRESIVEVPTLFQKIKNRFQKFKTRFGFNNKDEQLLIGDGELYTMAQNANLPKDSKFKDSVKVNEQDTNVKSNSYKLHSKDIESEKADKETQKGIDK